MIVFLSIFIFKIHFFPAVVDPGEGPPYLLTKLRPEGAKKNFFGARAPPFLRVWMTRPLLISRSGSSTALIVLGQVWTLIILNILSVKYC